MRYLYRTYLALYLKYLQCIQCHRLYSVLYQLLEREREENPSEFNEFICFKFTTKIVLCSVCDLRNFASTDKSHIATSKTAITNAFTRFTMLELCRVMFALHYDSVVLPSSQFLCVSSSD